MKVLLVKKKEHGNLPVNILPAMYPSQSHTQAFSTQDDFPKTVTRTFSQGSSRTSMDFHPIQQTLLLVGTSVGDIALWEAGSCERNFCFECGLVCVAEPWNWRRNILRKVYKQLEALWSLKATSSWEEISLQVVGRKSHIDEDEFSKRITDAHTNLAGYIRTILLSKLILDVYLAFSSVGNNVRFFLLDSHF
ncbi:hypothetical protein MKW98_023479 [Papaver atlanticum]|uniref:Uncharacterized protein n=1 Tax=Papaver atlanticum TaxID=357466 RepID=A0AAD4XMT4_9MAGN|nr:hypothetical protein MKW98_023479 [Papaver atlanticum]